MDAALYKKHELFLRRDQIEQYVRKFTSKQQHQWVVKPIEKHTLQPNFKSIQLAPLSGN